MTTVYLVSSGEYSSYGVGPVFSTEALAQEYIDKWAKFGDNEYGIEERELDPEHELNIPLQNGWSHFEVIMFKNGSSNIKKTKPLGKYVENATGFLGQHWIENKFSKEITLFCHVWSKDENGAVKIVNEKRVHLIASGQWDKEEKELEKRNRKNTR